MMDVEDVSRIVRNVIVTGAIPCTLMLVQESGQVWRITVRDERQALVSFDVPKGAPTHIREAIQKYLESDE